MTADDREGRRARWNDDGLVRYGAAATGAALFVSSSTLAGCGGCDLSTCVSLLQVVVAGDLAPGSTYDIEVSVDGEVSSCSVPSGTAGAEGCLTSNGGQLFRPEPPDLLVGNFPPGDLVGVIVLEDGSEVARLPEQQVLYETRYPNGEGCPGACEVASVQVDIDGS